MGHYVHQLYEAIKWAVDVHSMDGSNGFGKSLSIPYIYHPIRVASTVANAGGSIDMQFAAVLHDTYEDIDGVELEDIEARFGSRITELVALLSHAPGQPYDEYIESLVQDQEAAGIKAADIADNLTREDELAHEDNHEFHRIRRLKKYRRALMLLHSGLSSYTELDNLPVARKEALVTRLEGLFPKLVSIDVK